MTDPWQQQNQWQQPQPTSQYEVTPVNQGWIQPLSPVLPQELPPERPPTITASMWSWLAGAVLSVALVPLLVLTNADSVITSMEDSTTEAEAGRRAGEMLVTLWSVFGGFGMLVAAAPYIAFSIVLRNGYNWARILLTILGVVGVFAMIPMAAWAVRGQMWQLNISVVIVIVGLAVAATVLMYLPASNRFVR